MCGLIRIYWFWIFFFKINRPVYSFGLRLYVLVKLLVRRTKKTLFGYSFRTKYHRFPCRRIRTNNLIIYGSETGILVGGKGKMNGKRKKKIRCPYNNMCIILFCLRTLGRLGGRVQGRNSRYQCTEVHFFYVFYFFLISRFRTYYWAPYILCFKIFYDKKKNNNNMNSAQRPGHKKIRKYRRVTPGGRAVTWSCVKKKEEKIKKLNAIF